MTILFNRVEVNAIDRKIIDDFVTKYPQPKPPLKDVVIWGDIVDQYHDEDDPDYKVELIEYRINLVRKQFTHLVGAIQVYTDWKHNVDFIDLVEAGVTRANSFFDYLWFVELSDTERFKTVINEIFYLSTVTDRGIQEAFKTFDATWYKKPIDRFRVKRTEAGYNQIFEDREAARFGHYSWTEFCKLPGYEQSALVAQYRLRIKLDYLIGSDK